MKIEFNEKQLEKIVSESSQWRVTFQSLIFQIKRLIDIFEELTGKKGGEKQ